MRIAAVNDEDRRGLIESHGRHPHVMSAPISLGKRGRTLKAIAAKCRGMLQLQAER
jgi:hypothetical protein